MTQQQPPQQPPQETVETLRQKLEALQKQVGQQPPTQPKRAPAPPKQEQPPASDKDALAEFANTKAKEVALLRTAQKYGLKEEDLAELEFDTPTELELAARVKKQELDNASLVAKQTEIMAALEELKKPKEEAADEVLQGEDTGGRSGRAARRIDKAKQMYDLAKEKGRTHEGRLALLEGIRRDPSKQFVAPSYDHDED